MLAFFDAEEPPHFFEPSMGSIRFYEDQLHERIHCAIVMDLVGHDVPIPGLEDLVFITGMESDPGLESVVRDCEPTSVIRTVPTLNSYVGDMSDHGVFRMHEHPYLFLTCGRWEHYHQPTDTPDKLNYEKVAAISEYVCGLTERVCGAALKGPFEGYDSTETELYFFRNNLQPLLRSMGMDVDLDTRQDIDKGVELLLTRFEL